MDETFGFDLKIMETNLPMEDFMKTPEFQSFNEQCSKYMEDIAKTAMEGLNLTEMYIFLKWWHGQKDLNLTPDEVFKNHVKAYNAIHYAISMGCG